MERETDSQYNLLNFEFCNRRQQIEVLLSVNVTKYPCLQAVIYELIN